MPSQDQQFLTPSKLHLQKVLKHIIKSLVNVGDPSFDISSNATHMVQRSRSPRKFKSFKKLLKIMHISNQDQVAHAVISVQRNLGEEAWRPNLRKRATVMPKRYLPYQFSNGKPSQNTKKKIVVINNGSKKAPNVQKEVGAVFLHQEEEQVVDVETVGSEELSFLFDSKVQSITQKPAVVKQEVVEEDIKKPSFQAVEIKTTEAGCSPVSASVKQLSTSAKSPAKQPPPPGQADTIAFVNVLLHALKCPL